MCGRYTLVSKAVFTEFGVAPPGDFSPRYNVAPGQDCPVFLREGPGWTLHKMRWGLIPHWAKDASFAFKTINARSETVTEKPSYRDAFRKTRCVVPADGYYEWPETPGSKLKTPMHFVRPDRTPFVFAGLWSTWKGANPALDTFTLMTAAAAPSFASLHDRAPVLLDREEALRWTDPAASPADLKAMLQPFGVGEILGFEVSRAVNKAVHDAPDCVEPVPGGKVWPEPK